MDRKIKSKNSKYPNIITLSLIGTILGILLGYKGLSIIPLLIFIAFSFLFPLILNKKFFFLSFFLLLLIILTYQKTVITENHITNFQAEQITSLTGKVLKSRETPFSVRHTILVTQLVLEDNNPSPSSGKVLLTTRKRDIFPAGSFIVAKDVSLRKFSSPKNPGEENLQKIMNKQGIYLEGRSRDIILSSTPSNFFTKIFNKLKESAVLRIEKYFKYFPEEESLLEAMTLGKENIPYFLKDIGKKSGVYHLLVISGLHLAFLILFLKILFIPFKNFNNLHPKFFPTISLLILWVYAGITGFRVPVMRAALMLSFFFLAEIFEFEISGIESVLLAGILLLLFNPLGLFDVSFQLSFMATIGILFFIRRYNFLVKKGFLWGGIVSSLGAQISVLPIIIYYFGVFYPIGLINNIIFMPLSAAIMLTFPLFLLFPPLFFMTLKFILTLFIYLATLSSQSTKGIETNLTLSTVFLLYLFIIFFFSRLDIKKRFVLTSCTLIILVTIIFAPRFSKNIYEDKLYILSLNSPSAFFINGKEVNAFLSDNYNQKDMKNILIPFLKEKKIKNLETLLYTNISYNHIGTIKEVEKKIKIKNVYEHENIKNYFFYPYQNIYFENNKKYSFTLHQKYSKAVIPDMNVKFLNVEKDRVSYIITKGDYKILISPYISQEIAEAISEQKFDIAWISDMKKGAQIKRLLETTQFDYLLLPKKLKKFTDLNSSIKTFYLDEGAVIIDFSLDSLGVTHFKDLI